jgi:prevent-host-death family protein
VREDSAVYTVREAKARFSEILRLAEQGNDVIITSHGRPKVCITKAEQEVRPFRVARRWLQSMKADKRQTPAEQIIREDRDARG